MLQTNVAVLLMLTLLTALWIVLAIVDSGQRHSQRRRQWFALLFAPFGALLRWKLALLNGRMPKWKWYPVGTLAANLVACCIDFGTQVNHDSAENIAVWNMKRDFFGGLTRYTLMLASIGLFCTERRKISITSGVFNQATLAKVSTAVCCRQGCKEQTLQVTG